jgi:hypothetical protein
VSDGHPDLDAYVNQAAAEIAFAKSMGWDDWTHDEESEEGMVRGYRVQWSPVVVSQQAGRVEARRQCERLRVSARIGHRRTR